MPLSDQELFEMYGRTECQLCGERLTQDDTAEMYRVNAPERSNVIVHYECGKAAGLELA
jgi:hypothetical protein